MQHGTIGTLSQSMDLLLAECIKDNCRRFIRGARFETLGGKWLDLDQNIIITIVLGLVGWIYDRGRRYNYLADRWYNLMSINDDIPEFFDPNMTKKYDKLFVKDRNSKYNQHARMYWAFVEDVTGNDRCFDKLLRYGSFEKLYENSINDIVKLHYTWLFVPKNSVMFSKKFIKWVEKLKSPSVEVKSQGTLQEHGVFAKQKFRKCDFIGFFEGEEVYNRTNMSLQFAPNFYVEPSLTTPFRNLNHSCDANAFLWDRNLYARRQIDKDQEITIDYNCSEFELFAPFQCNCGTEACVGCIRGYNFLSQDERERRREWVPSWLKKMGNTTECGA